MCPNVGNGEVLSCRRPTLSTVPPELARPHIGRLAIVVRAAATRARGHRTPGCSSLARHRRLQTVVTSLATSGPTDSTLIRRAAAATTVPTNDAAGQPARSLLLSSRAAGAVPLLTPILRGRRPVGLLCLRTQGLLKRTAITVLSEHLGHLLGKRMPRLRQRCHVDGP